MEGILSYCSMDVPAKHDTLPFEQKLKEGVDKLERMIRQMKLSKLNREKDNYECGNVYK